MSQNSTKIFVYTTFEEPKPASYNNVCSKGHFAHPHICENVSKQELRKPVNHKRLVLTRRGGESERIQESKNLSVARTVACHC